MKEFYTGFLKVISGKDGPLIWALTSITALTLGWKFLDSGYQAEGVNWKIFRSADSCQEDSTEEASNPPSLNSE